VKVFYGDGGILIYRIYSRISRKIYDKILT